jgi:hypothetical protein
MNLHSYNKSNVINAEIVDIISYVRIEFENNYLGTLKKDFDFERLTIDESYFLNLTGIMDAAIKNKVGFKIIFHESNI